MSSTSFQDSGPIPSKYTCDGQDISPEIRIADVPPGTKSLALIMEDPDVPKHLRADGMWDHWVVWNIPPETMIIPEGSLVGVKGKNTSGSLGYQGPCPPDREHRYFFKLYALNRLLDIEEGAAKKDLQDAMKGHILAEAVLLGIYDRKKV